MQALSLSPSAKAWVFPLALNRHSPRECVLLPTPCFFPRRRDWRTPSESITKRDGGHADRTQWRNQAAVNRGPSFMLKAHSSPPGPSCLRPQWIPKFSVLCLQVERLVKWKTWFGHFSIDLVTLLIQAPWSSRWVDLMPCEILKYVKTPIPSMLIQQGPWGASKISCSSDELIVYGPCWCGEIVLWL